MARVNILSKPLGVQNEDIWVKRYVKDPRNPVNVYGAALVYSLKGDPNKAERLLKTIDVPYKTVFLADFLIGQRRFSEAIDILKGENDPIGLFYLGKAYEGLNNLLEAEASFGQILPYGNSFPEIYQRFAMVNGRMGNEAKGYEYLGRFYLETGRDQQAKMYLEKAVTKYGINSPEATEILEIVDTLNPEKKGNPNKQSNGQ